MKARSEHRECPKVRPFPDSGEGCSASWQYLNTIADFSCYTINVLLFGFYFNCFFLATLFLSPNPACISNKLLFRWFFCLQHKTLQSYLKLTSSVLAASYICQQYDIWNHCTWPGTYFRARQRLSNDKYEKIHWESRIECHESDRWVRLHSLALLARLCAIYYTSESIRASVSIRNHLAGKNI